MVIVFGLFAVVTAVGAGYVVASVAALGLALLAGAIRRSGLPAVLWGAVVALAVVAVIGASVDVLRCPNPPVLSLSFPVPAGLA